MIMGNSITNLPNLFNYLESAISNATQNAGVSPAAPGSANGTSASGSPSDNGELSPLGQILSQLQQIQQSDPTEYAQLTGQIATNLQNAAQSATNGGNTTAANQLNQLAQDFETASQSGELPNIGDLAHAIGGSGLHHHHHAESSNSEDNSTSQVSQLFAPLEPNGSENSAASIILNTLVSASASSTNS